MIIDEAIQKLIANGRSADVDRVIQQALLIVLTLVLDPQFSESSYGFMEGRGAHMALLKSQEYVKQGYQWVVELDLSKFFDRVNHDIPMSLVAKVLEDKIIQKLIRLYLKAGIMEEGLVNPRSGSVPQGAHQVHSCQTLCSLSLIVNWKSEVISFVGMLTAATSM